MNTQLLDAHLNLIRAELMKDVARIIKVCYPAQVQIAIDSASHNNVVQLHAVEHDHFYGAELGAYLGEKYFGGDDVPSLTELRSALLHEVPETRKAFTKYVDRFIETKPELNNVYRAMLETITQ